MAKRVELAGVAADEDVGRVGLVDRGDLQPLPLGDPEPRLPVAHAPAARAPVLGGPGLGPVAPAQVTRPRRR